jgi:hypothetical protein
VVFASVIPVTLPEESRTGKRKRLTVRTICRNLGRKNACPAATGGRVLSPVQELLYLPGGSAGLTR